MLFAYGKTLKRLHVEVDDQIGNLEHRSGRRNFRFRRNTHFQAVPGKVRTVQIMTADRTVQRIDLGKL